MRPAPSRVLVALAIKLTREKRKEALIPENISIDAAIVLISIVDMRRDRRDAAEAGYDLRQLVRETCEYAKFDPGRRYAYEVVLMRYYTLLSAIAARRRRRWSISPKRKPTPNVPA